jgi:hypothetical protein
MHIRRYEAAHFGGLDALRQKAFPNDPPRNSAKVAVPAKIAVQPDLSCVAVD